MRFPDKKLSDFSYMERGVCGHIRDYHHEKAPGDLVASGCTYPGCGYIGPFRGTGKFGTEHPGLGRWDEDRKEWVRVP